MKVDNYTLDSESSFRGEVSKKYFSSLLLTLRGPRVSCDTYVKDQRQKPTRKIGRQRLQKVGEWGSILTSFPTCLHIYHLVFRVSLRLYLSSLSTRAYRVQPSLWRKGHKVKVPDREPVYRMGKCSLQYTETPVLRDPTFKHHKRQSQK